MIWFILYLISIPVAGLVFLYLNKDQKWVTQNDLYSLNGDFIGAAVFFGILFWPIALVIVAICLLFRWCAENLFPDS